MSEKIQTESLRIDKFDSSAVKAAMYNYLSEDLTVRFPSGKLYTYTGVEADTYMKMIYSDSIGKAFNDLIKDNYNYKESEDLSIIPG